MREIILKYQKQFLEEIPEKLENLEYRILDLERANPHDSLGELKNLLHSIKGNSGSVELSSIAHLCHEFEIYLEKSGKEENWKEITSISFKYFNLLKDVCEMGADIDLAMENSINSQLDQINPKDKAPDSSKGPFLIQEHSKFVQNLYKQNLGSLGREINFFSELQEINIDRVGVNSVLICTHAKTLKEIEPYLDDENRPIKILVSNRNFFQEKIYPDHVIPRSSDYFIQLKNLIEGK